MWRYPRVFGFPVKHAFFHDPADEFHGKVDGQLTHHARPVRLHCLDADLKLIRNNLVALAHGQACQNFELAAE